MQHVDAASVTLTALGERLRRLELLLRGQEGGGIGAGGDEDEDEQTRPAAARLDKIEKRLADLCSHSAPAAELLRLHTRLPELLGNDQDGSARAEDDTVPASKQLPIVLASSTAILDAASQLEWIQNNPIPSTGSLAQLASLKGRLEKARTTQQQQMDQIADLRNYTACLLGQWYAGAILKEGEQWVEWEQRLARVEQTVRRQESSRAREQNEV